MRDYMYEIEKLRMEIGELKLLIEDYQEKQKRLLREKGGLILHPECALQQVFKSENPERKLFEYKELKNAYEMYGQRIKELCDEVHAKQVKLGRLRGVFKRTHKQEFYRPMDEIDICNLIGKDGFIVGVKF